MEIDHQQLDQREAATQRGGIRTRQHVTLLRTHCPAFPVASSMSPMMIPVDFSAVPVRRRHHPMRTKGRPRSRGPDDEPSDPPLTVELRHSPSKPEHHPEAAARTIYHRCQDLLWFTGIPPSVRRHLSRVGRSPLFLDRWRSEQHVLRPLRALIDPRAKQRDVVRLSTRGISSAGPWAAFPNRARYRTRNRSMGSSRCVRERWPPPRMRRLSGWHPGHQCGKGHAAFHRCDRRHMNVPGAA